MSKGTDGATNGAPIFEINQMAWANDGKKIIEEAVAKMELLRQESDHYMALPLSTNTRADMEFLKDNDQEK